MKRVDDIVKAAMLDPQLARALLEKVPSKPDTGSAWKLTQALRKATLTGAAIGSTGGTAQPQAAAPVKQAAAMVEAPEVFNALGIPPQNAFAQQQPPPAVRNALAFANNSNALAYRNRDNSSKTPPPVGRASAWGR